MFVTKWRPPMLISAAWHQGTVHSRGAEMVCCVSRTRTVFLERTRFKKFTLIPWLKLALMMLEHFCSLRRRNKCSNLKNDQEAVVVSRSFSPRVRTAYTPGQADLEHDYKYMVSIFYFYSIDVFLPVIHYCMSCCRPPYLTLTLTLWSCRLTKQLISQVRRKL